MACSDAARKRRLARRGQAGLSGAVAILSIQSQVVRGAVGNSGATLILSRLGHEVWPLPTVLLSHHPGHGDARGGPLDHRHLASLLDGLEARGTFGDCAAVLSGYLGGAEAAGIVLRGLALARAANPDTLFVLDPVMGDLGRTYVPESLVAAIRARLLPAADIVLPNPYELGLLAGAEPGDRAEAFTALAALRRPIALLTGFAGADTPAGTLDILLAAGKLSLIATVPRIEGHFSGAGDAFAALFLGHFLRGRDAEAALGAAATAMTRLLAATRAAGADELAIVAADAAWSAPSAAEDVRLAPWRSPPTGCKSS